MPLLYHTTRDSGLVPGQLFERCRDAYLETGIHNTLRLESVATLLNEAHSRGIQVIALKGAALAGQVYGNLGLRPMMDIDLLVRINDVHETRALLRECDFHQIGQELSPGTALAYENELSYSKRDRIQWQLELHWSLFNSPYYQRHLAEECIWQAAEPITIGGAPAYSLSPEWTLLHLCGHMALHHRRAGLLWWNDIADAIGYYTERFNWDELMTLAETAHLVRPLQSILPAMAKDWHAQVPVEQLARLGQLVPAADEVKASKAIVDESWPAGHQLMADVRSMRSWPERIRFFYHNMIPSGAYMDQRYNIRHPAMRAYYYVRRWLIGLAGLAREDPPHSRNH